MEGSPSARNGSKVERMNESVGARAHQKWSEVENDKPACKWWPACAPMSSAVRCMSNVRCKCNERRQTYYTKYLFMYVCVCVYYATKRNSTKCEMLCSKCHFKQTNSQHAHSPERVLNNNDRNNKKWMSYESTSSNFVAISTCLCVCN